MAKKKSTAKKGAKKRAKKGSSRKAPQSATKLVKRHHRATHEHNRCSGC